MKFQPDTLAGTNVLTRHEAGRLWVGTVPFEHSVLVPWQGDVQAWPPGRFEDLTPGDFAAIAALQPAVVIFGSGARLRFPSPAMLRGLIERRIGVETMDTAAACRTYNVLAAEGRSVVAALLVSTGGD
ncbi:MAG: Mth938-like domain-containing protein [Rubrivivax sp.]|nr:Mth938-like domain-containing protein [Rubrivivax sp.]MDH5340640.1 Mth938-like domain-containing protein [Rubrivivax sp.]